MPLRDVLHETLEVPFERDVILRAADYVSNADFSYLCLFL